MIMHFDDCPYNCNSKGELFDRGLGRFTDCSYCKKRRKELADRNLTVKEHANRVEDLHEVLGFNDAYLSSEFSLRGIFPDKEIELIEEVTLKELSDGIEELRGSLLNGELPSKSYLFGLARKGSPEKLAYPLMVSAYKEGVSSLYYASSRIYYNDYLRGADVRKFYDTKLLFIVIASGSSYNEINTLKGLLETRASLGLATIFITTDSVDAVSLLMGYRSEPSLYLGSPFFAERSKTYDTTSYSTDKKRGRDYSMSDFTSL